MFDYFGLIQFVVNNIFDESTNSLVKNSNLIFLCINFKKQNIH